MSQGFRDLIAWKKGMAMVSEVYRATETFPQQETYGLVSQLRRAAVSVPSNIAEGKAHHSNRDFVRFLRHARGSLAEIETQILISQDSNYLNEETAVRLTLQLDELGRVISGLINSLKDQD